MKEKINKQIIKQKFCSFAWTVNQTSSLTGSTAPLTKLSSGRKWLVSFKVWKFDLEEWCHSKNPIYKLLNISFYTPWRHTGELEAQIRSMEVNGQTHELADLLPDKGITASINYGNNYEQDPTLWTRPKSMHVRKLISDLHINQATGQCTGVNKSDNREQIRQWPSASWTCQLHLVHVSSACTSEYHVSNNVDQASILTWKLNLTARISAVWRLEINL